MFDKKSVTPAMVSFIKAAGDVNPSVAFPAQRLLSQALNEPLRKGILRGNILWDIFETPSYPHGQEVKYPIDVLNPGTEKDFAAYVMPNHGSQGHRVVEGDYVSVPTYWVGNNIAANLKYLRDANWDVMGRLMQIMAAGFVRKMNTDGWRTLIGAGVARNLTFFDEAATAGLFTKRHVELGSNILRRNGGGNVTSLNRKRLTHLFISPEAIGDMRSWDITQVDDITRREIFLGENDLEAAKIFGKVIIPLDELGVGQEYQLYYTSSLAQTMPSDKVEITIGLDVQSKDSFVMPFRAEPEIFEDITLHRQHMWGVYGWAEYGVSVLDVRNVLIGAL